MKLRYSKSKIVTPGTQGLIALIILIALISSIYVIIDASNPKRVAENFKFYNVEKNDWKSKRVNQLVGDINYTATEVPLKYYLLKNIEDKKQNIDSIYGAHKKERILEIEFEHLDKKDLLLQEFSKKSYDAAVKYMAFRIDKDFTVVTSSNDTIQCTGVQFERNFKVAPFKRVLLYFNDIHPNDTFQLVYQDQLFGNGTIKFNFNKTLLKL